MSVDEVLNLAILYSLYLSDVHNGVHGGSDGAVLSCFRKTFSLQSRDKRITCLPAST
jgi:hypothetical protein